MEKSNTSEKQKYTWHDVDKSVENAVKSGKIHYKTADNTTKGNIRAITYKDVEYKKPGNFNDWKLYSHKLLDDFQDIIENKKTPNWDNLLFRNEDDFRSGTFGLYPEIWLTKINSLPNQQNKTIAYAYMDI